MKTTCYMCDAEATSREHVPPLCLFPEPKDVKGLNFRNNLITVPSCDEHNSKKSCDDEFLMLSIAGIVGNNAVGYMQTVTKVNRALKRKTVDFLGKVVMKNIKATSVKIIEGYEFPVLFGKPDHERFTKCFESIVHGLYFHEYKQRFVGEIRLIMAFLMSDHKDRETFIEFCRERFAIEDLKLEEKGTNPHIFKYQFCEPDNNNIIAFKLTFYGGTEVFGSMRPEGTPMPFDILQDIMSKGVPVTYELEGKEYRFNQNENKKDNFSN